MSTVAYLAAARQRFIEFGGFYPVDLARLSPVLAQHAESLMERAEPGLTTYVALASVVEDRLVRDLVEELVALGRERSKSDQTKVAAVLVIATDQPITRACYSKWQGFKIELGSVTVVPWVVDLVYHRLLEHQGSPTGLDPDLALLAAPELSEEAELEPCVFQPTGPVPRADLSAEWVAPAHDPAPERQSYSGPRATVVLLGIIVAVWVLMTIAGRSFDSTRDIEMLIAWGAVDRPFLWIHGEYWRLLTAAFLHIGIEHLVVNAISLWSVGQVVEAMYGPVKMVFIFLVSAVLGSVVSAMVGPPMVVSAGASGAVFGLLGAVIWFRLSSPLGGRIALRPLLTILGLNLAFGLALYRYIDNWNHLGGLLGGFLAAFAAGVPGVAYMAPPRFRFRPSARLGIMVATALACVAVLVGMVELPGPGRGLAQGMLLYDEQRFAEAEPYIAKAVQRQPEQPGLRDALVVIYLAEGRCRDAQHELTQLSSRQPDFDRLPLLRQALSRCS